MSNLPPTGRLFLLACAGLVLLGGGIFWLSKSSFAPPIAQAPSPVSVPHFSQPEKPGTPLATPEPSALELARVELAAALRVADPRRKTERVWQLLNRLMEAGEYALAVQLTQSIPPTKSTNLCADFLPAVFSKWAASHPTEAMRALAMIEDASLRETAGEAVISAWSPAQLPALANHALTLPTGEKRTFVLDQAMQKWGLQDPAALAQWLTDRAPTPELDSGAALLATQADGANRPPDIAAQWAETITDPALRLSSVAHVLREWTATDPLAAKKYVETAQWPTPEERQQMLEALQPKATAEE